MKTSCIDIFNNHCLGIFSNFQTHNADILIIKKTQNKQALRLFISSILSPFFLLIFTCIPVQVCAGRIMRSDFGYKVGGIFPMPPFRFATSRKFIKIIENMLKRFMFISLFVWLALPLVAQEKRGSTYIFRFVPGKDMFLIPYRQNASQWKELCDTLNVCMQQIKDGEMYINVSSYAATSGIRPASRVAYMRNNRVKAELITRLGLKEKMFVTDRIIPIGYGANNLHDVVVVTFPTNVSNVARVAGDGAATHYPSLSSPETQGEAVPNSVPLDDSNTNSDSGEAVVVPQTITKGTAFIKVKLSNDAVFSYKIPDSSDLTLESGKKYTYKITVNQSGLTVTSKIEPWTPVSAIEGDAL